MLQRELFCSPVVVFGSRKSTSDDIAPSHPLPESFLERLGDQRLVWRKRLGSFPFFVWLDRRRNRQMEWRERSASLTASAGSVVL
jgi:hypothetical protein